MTHRSLFIIALSMLGVAAHAQSPDRPPTTPGGLSAEVYSPTFAVIEWQRSSDDRGAVVGYEVRRDGTLLGTFDALSYVDRDLLPGRGYNYVVRAVDNSGQRSTRATIRAVTPDADPLPVSGLRSDIYSRTTAELFWDRSTVFGERYEIKRDGVVITSTDGTSHFDNTLSAARPYLFEVISLNREGKRSAPVRLFVDTTGDGTDPEPETGPAAPAGLRASVYSGTAGEIFWERPETFGLRYDVSRDGERLTTTDGTSWYDNTLTRGTRYTYEIVAIDLEGRRSTASSVTLTTTGSVPVEPPPAEEPFSEPDPGAASVLARLGYPVARDLADDLVSTSYLSLYYDIDDALIALLLDPEYSEEDVTGACPGGGTATGALGFFFFIDVQLDACSIEGRTLTGHLVFESVFVDSPAFSSNGNVTLTFDALDIDAGADGRLIVSGTSARRYNRGPGNPACGQAPTVFDEIDNRIESAQVEIDGETTLVSGASWTQTVQSEPVLTGRPLIDPCVVRVTTVATEGEASVTSTRFGPNEVTLEKRAELVRDSRGDDRSATDARLAADFGDNSTLVVTASSGNTDEVQVDLVADGVAVSFSDDYRFEAREDLPALSGR